MQLFTTFMGKDFLAYRYTEDLSCVVVEEDCPLLKNDDASWDNIGKMKLIKRQWLESEMPCARKKKKGRIPKKVAESYSRPARERRTVITHPWFLPLPQKVRVQIKRMSCQIFAMQNANRDWLHLWIPNENRHHQHQTPQNHRNCASPKLTDVSLGFLTENVNSSHL